MTKTRRPPRILAIATVVALLLTQGLAVTGGPELPNPGKVSMSRDQQIQLGLQASQKVYQQMPVLPDNSSETQYIRQLGAKLVAVVPQQYSWPYEFHVIPQKEINAFALPGGQIFINVGTITAASNEAELVGVMAHEMSHVYMQHSAKQVGKTQTTALIAGLAGALLGATGGGLLSELAQAGIQFGAQGIILKYSREDEAQADAVGAIIAYKAGYNPQGMADFFQKLAAQGGEGPQFLSDHPNPGNRQQAIKQEIAGWPRKNYQTSSAAFDRARQQAQSIKVYTAQQIAAGAKTGEWTRMNKQNGAQFTPPSGMTVPASQTTSSAAPAGPVSLQSVLPSSRMVNESLGPVSISRPDNWQVIGPSQRGADVQIAPAAGVSGDNVGYGVVMNGVKLQNGSTNLDEATKELVSHLEQGAGLQQVSNPETIRVAGVEGRSVNLQSNSPFPDANGKQQPERDWLVVVPRSDGSFLYFVFVAPVSQFDKFQPTFNAMVRSVRLS
jgi:Zn-dependent protease with chaperone function